MKVTITMDYDGREFKNIEIHTEEVKENVDTSKTAYSQYAKMFDESSTVWSRNPQENILFLRAMERCASDILCKNGYLFLNDVYEMVGLPKTKAGQVVGWVYDTNNPIGDNRVDFGIFDTNKEPVDIYNMKNGIMLDFNVDGNILGLID